MNKYTVTLRDRVFMEMNIEVDASSAEEARALAKELQHTGEFEWVTTGIHALSPLTKRHLK